MRMYLFICILFKKFFNMIVCFDLETTGLDKYNDKIIEISSTESVITNIAISLT